MRNISSTFNLFRLIELGVQDKVAPRARSNEQQIKHDATDQAYQDEQHLLNLWYVNNVSSQDAGGDEMETEQTKRYRPQHLHQLLLSDICARVFP